MLFELLHGHLSGSPQGDDTKEPPVYLPLLVCVTLRVAALPLVVLISVI